MVEYTIIYHGGCLVTPYLNIFIRYSQDKTLQFTLPLQKRILKETLWGNDANSLVQQNRTFAEQVADSSGEFGVGRRGPRKLE